jgi:protocatechuate 3,4-dioxygenase, alpha subunit
MPEKPMADRLIPTPSQTVGPFFHLGMNRPEWADLTVGGPSGERIAIEGSVLDGDGAAVPDAVIEVWQANEAGRYNHPDDDRDDKLLDPGFRGFGRVATGADGGFRLVTIKPGPVPGRGNALQAPHINVAVFARGLLRHLYTRIYFADDPRNAADPLLSSIDDAAVRGTLLARNAKEGKGSELPVYRFDIVLQGENETAFLDI